MYSTQAHDGPISALTYSASYIISAGGDNKICVWERFQGHLLQTIQLVSFPCQIFFNSCATNCSLITEQCILLKPCHAYS